jgi:hypothetical protein
MWAFCFLSESQALFDTDGHFIGILWTAPTGETVCVPRTLNSLGHREKCQHQHRDHQVGEACERVWDQVLVCDSRGDMEARDEMGISASGT